MASPSLSVERFGPFGHSEPVHKYAWERRIGAYNWQTAMGELVTKTLGNLSPPAVEGCAAVPRPDSGQSSVVVHPPYQPRLHVNWIRRRQHVLEDLLAIFSGPRAGKLPRKMRFHDSWRPRRFRALCFSFSSLLHVLFIALPLPIWLAAYTERDVRQPSDVHLTWSGPVKDLPSLAPKSNAAKAEHKPEIPSPAPKAEPDPVPARIDRVARQTIVAAPARPNHPRQMLLQPETAPEPPKILPALPNIVEWGRASQPARPRLPISREVLAKLRPKHRSRRAISNEAAPTLPNQELHASALSISSNAPNIPKPSMPVSAGSTPILAERRVMGDNVVPDLGPPVPNFAGGDDSARRVIALSADPAPPPPSLDLPTGNLAARVAVSPLGPMPGPDAGAIGGTGKGSASSGSGNGSGGSGGGGSGGPGPSEVFISSGDPNKTSNVVGPGGGTGGGTGSGLGPSRGGSPGSSPPRLSGRDLAAGSGFPRAGLPSPPSGNSDALGGFEPTRPEEAVLRQKRVYSLSLNMPNMTSVTGSWIVRFAELNVEKVPAKSAAGELSAPEALRKVDPRYPPALKDARIEGDVVLYAIIRKDGTVDSVQVLKSLEPQLDRNAMDAFTRWQFWPASRNGIPVDIETVVTIPFRAFSPR
ncbi:MAG: TonB family protein [Acidobacteria bacterium]|nr:TonB family protein [Acidobacteriota bacterium]